MRLAVEKLNLCHTHEDVQLAFQQLPVGMEALYDRMASTITHNLSQTDRSLARAILEYITCSLRVLTVAELSQALGEKATAMLDFPRSVVDLCGGFVVIDNGGNIAMIHQTAREYLLGETGRPFHIDRGAAHEQIFLSCMQALMAIGLRAKVNRNQQPEFLEYAAKLWSSHLTFIPVNSKQVDESLKRFLTRNWILTWIQILAAGNHLRVLIQASKNLSRYAAKQKALDLVQNETGSRFMEQELVESWAGDLVRIVGKFGANLRRNPEHIYNLIPPFCPQNSSIYQLFGKQEARNLKVSGLSNANWDDSLARISLGFGTYASSILAAGAQIAILASSGIVFMFDSSIFQEGAASPIKHGERVYRMELNSTGTLIATYGYRTTKIWEISTGRCRTSVANIESRPRPLTMLLTTDILIVGFEDRRVRSLDLTQSYPSWQLVAELEEPELDGHYLNSSNCMALNKDGSLIAVAYRGHPLSAWEVDGPMHVGHCWRKRDELARGEVIEAMWHPLYAEVLGLYIEGVVFKWRPYDDRVDEVATGASRLAMTRDGNLFATGDVHGTVKVFTTSDLGLLYQLASQDTVLGIAFSPDLQRFYDIRGYYGNAWEPSALMRFAEETDSGMSLKAESLAESSTVSMNWSQRIDSTTVLATSPTNRLYCCGTENGTVRLHDTQQGKIADIYASKSFLSIEMMTWSSDGTYICFSDSGKKVFVMTVAPGASNLNPVIERMAEIPMKNNTKGPILQLLFHPDSSCLLVYTSSTVCIISLESCSVIHSLDFDTAECKWIIHPQNSSLIVGISPRTVRVLDWDLVLNQAYNVEFPLHSGRLTDFERSLTQDVVDRVLVTHDKKTILVQLSLLSENRKEKIFLRIDSSTLIISATTFPDIAQNGDLKVLTPSVLPMEVSFQIEFVLSFLPHDRLIYLSRTFTICSWQLSSFASHDALTAVNNSSINNSNTHQNRHNSVNTKNTAAGLVKELFSLPGDWISRDCLALCSVWGREKSLLCPRNGEVAVVRCAALA